MEETSGRQTPPPGEGNEPSAGLLSPGIKVELYRDSGDDDGDRPSSTNRHLVAPAGHRQYHSPIRHHKRTPSIHRTVKETLDARSEYMNDEDDGRSHHRINQYVIRDEIGRGSYGAVHLATDQFGNEYAVKEFSKARLRRRAQSNILRQGPGGLRGPRPGRMPPPLRDGLEFPGQANSRFRDQRANEAKDSLFLIREETAIMKKLNHPNLVQLIEVLDDPEEDSLYMVLEMCKKGVIMKVGLNEPAEPYPPEKCRYWFRDLILGIEYLHAQGVVHRDIKPDNLLLTEDDVLKVVDFGVSEMFEKSDVMRTAKSAGSPAFLPPELCVGKHGDVSGKAADIWSMGVSLYCLRYGRIPFERSGVLEMYEAIKTETAKMDPDEDEDFVDLMSNLLEKDPAKRITMEKLRDHPWVTKRGKDPLLSTEENCAEPIDPPNELELNHAFTRKMSHLLYVLKVITKFKGLVAQKRARDRHLEQGASGDQAEEKSGAETGTTEAVAGTGSGGDTVADHAARVLREREQFLRTTTRDGEGAAEERDTAQELANSEPRFLGVGMGGQDDFASDVPPPPDAVVSDSPTAVDFNVYDRAFEAEVEKIKRSTSRRGSGRRRGTGNVYPTKHLGDRTKYRGGSEAAARIGDQSSEAPVAPTRRPAVTFSDLVSHTMEVRAAQQQQRQDREEEGGQEGET